MILRRFSLNLLLNKSVIRSFLSNRREVHVSFVKSASFQKWLKDIWKRQMGPTTPPYTHCTQIGKILFFLLLINDELENDF